MNIQAIHTNILDEKEISDLRIIREDPNNYPKGKSNIYAKNAFGQIVWYAELLFTDDIYSNPIQWNKNLNIGGKNWNELIQESINSFVVSSWKGVTVSIDYKSGKLIQKEFTK